MPSRCRTLTITLPLTLTLTTLRHPHHSTFTLTLTRYANTHTEASLTGLQTSVLREEARAIVAQATNAPAEEYATLFVGTGLTALSKPSPIIAGRPAVIGRGWPNEACGQPEACGRG